MSSFLAIDLTVDAGLGLELLHLLELAGLQEERVVLLQELVNLIGHKNEYSIDGITMCPVGEVEPLGFDFGHLLVDFLLGLAAEELVEKAHSQSDVNIN